MEEAQRAVQRSGAEHRGCTYLPRSGGRRGCKRWRHVELALLVAAPPAGESGPKRMVALVDIQTADRAGSGVQILVGAPDGEVDVPLVQTMRNAADGVRAVEPDHHVVCP